MADKNDKLDYIQERVDTVVDRVADIGGAVESLKATFDNHIAQDEKLYQEFSRMTDILSKNTVSLAEHMRRTDIIEDYVKKMDARFTPLEMEQLRRKAVEGWVSNKLKLVAKIGAAVSAIGVLAYAAKYIITLILFQ